MYGPETIFVVVIKFYFHLDHLNTATIHWGALLELAVYCNALDISRVYYIKCHANVRVITCEGRACKYPDYLGGLRIAVSHIPMQSIFPNFIVSCLALGRRATEIGLLLILLGGAPV